MQQLNAAKEGGVFFKQWLRSPKSMGSIIPSSRFLAKALAGEAAWTPGRYVVELGGGTGAITQGLLDRGIPADKLVVIELETHLYTYLKGRFPDLAVVQGDATRLDEILERLGIVGQVSTVISGLPMVQMPLDFQRAIIEQGFKAMGGKGAMLQYSYSPVSPIPAKKLGVKAEIARRVVLNVPPAFVWRYVR